MKKKATAKKKELTPTQLKFAIQDELRDLALRSNDLAGRLDIMWYQARDLILADEDIGQ